MKDRGFVVFIVLALSQILGSAAQAAGALSEKDKIRADQWIEGHKRKLTQLEAYVAETEPQKILEAKIGGLNDLRRDMRQPHPNIDFRDHAEFANCDQRLMQLRTDLARRGLYVGEWREWQFDGQTVGNEEKKFLESFEDKFNGVRSANGVSPGNDEKLEKMKETLGRPEFGSNPVLKAYKESLGQHVLYGALYRNALLRVKAIGNSYRSLKNDVDKNWKGCKGECVKRVHRDADQVVAYIDQVKAAGLSLSEYKIKLDEREPLSDEWDLKKVRSEATKISKKN